MGGAGLEVVGQVEGFEEVEGGGPLCGGCGVGG